MNNKDYFEFHWGKYISYDDFSRHIRNGTRPLEVMKIVPMSNVTFHKWKRKVRSSEQDTTL
jgi:hypothetical protein